MARHQPVAIGLGLERREVRRNLLRFIRRPPRGMPVAGRDQGHAGFGIIPALGHEHRIVDGYIAVVVIGGLARIRYQPGFEEVLSTLLEGSARFRIGAPHAAPRAPSLGSAFVPFPGGFRGGRADAPVLARRNLELADGKSPAERIPPRAAVIYDTPNPQYLATGK